MASTSATVASGVWECPGTPVKLECTAKKSGSLRSPPLCAASSRWASKSAVLLYTVTRSTPAAPRSFSVCRATTAPACPGACDTAADRMVPSSQPPTWSCSPRKEMWVTPSGGAPWPRGRAVNHAPGAGEGEGPSACRCSSRRVALIALMVSSCPSLERSQSRSPTIGRTLSHCHVDRMLSLGMRPGLNWLRGSPMLSMLTAKGAGSFSMRSSMTRAPPLPS
mmetsp:Transcript_54192/g.171984  ORF Transcript_54192/g.171984 Transcript_54192/m.171984 type:complete len:222 (+) Transcript_54192:255-920(+)